MQRILLTRGTSWTDLRDWRALELADEPHLMTSRRRAQFPATLTPIEAANMAFRDFPDAELYMWDEPDWLPGRTTAGHTAIRVVATEAHGVWTVGTI